MQGNLNDIFANVDRGLFPGIKDGFQVKEKTTEAREAAPDLEDGAGTTRPHGRIAFFVNWDLIRQRLLNLVDASVQGTTRDGTVRPCA